MIKYALVQFSGKRERYVISTVDIRDFHPKAVTDFDPEKNYSIKWPVLRRENSDTTEDTYAGKILLLAATPESMVKRAQIANIRLPQAFLKSINVPKSRTEKLEIVAKHTSKQAHKQFAAALENATKTRMQEIISVHSASVSKKTDEEQMKDHVEPMKSAPSGEDSIPADEKCNETAPPTNHPEVKDALDEKPVDSSRKFRTRKRPRSKDHDSSDSNSECTYVSSHTEKKNLEDKILKLQLELAKERKKLRIAETEKTSACLALEKWKAAFENFCSSKPSSPSPAKYCNLDSWVESTLKYSGGKEPNQPSTSASTHKLRVTKNLFRDVDNTVVQSSPSKSFISSPMINQMPDQSKDASGKEVAGKAGASPPKTCSPSSKKEKKNAKSKKDSTLAPGQLECKELAPDLLRALKGEVELQLSDCGQKVLLGNDVYIKKSVWDARVKKDSVKLSIMVLDLAEEIWGFRKCATLSLHGGISPKTPSAPIKDIAPVEVVEVIKGVYRAKLMYQGMENDKHLDASMKGCLDSLRNEFKDAMRKVKNLEQKEKN